LGPGRKSLLKISTTVPKTVAASTPSLVTPGKKLSNGIGKPQVRDLHIDLRFLHFLRL